MSERPRHIAALISALQFQDPHAELLSSLDDREWQELLTFSDRAHLTLYLLSKACYEYLPDRVQERIGRNFADNTARLESIRRVYSEIAEALAGVGAEHLVLKGFAQWPEFVREIRFRMQSDIDLYCPDGALFRARDVLRHLGYADEVSPENNISDHIPPLIRRTGWKWRGNSFDPEMPPSVELHYRLWNASQTRLGPFDFGDFWRRRIERDVGSIHYTALHPVDNFSYCALHALRHLLFGGLTPSHIYELGFFLEHNHQNEQLWRAWFSWHDDALRSTVAVPCFLAGLWFGSRLPDAIEEEIHRLPSSIPRWFRMLADSPLTGLFDANKDALWLHLALIDSAPERYSVFARRLFPLWIPPLNSRWVQMRAGASSDGERKRVQGFFTYLYWFASRILAHIRMLPLALWQGLRLWAA